MDKIISIKGKKDKDIGKSMESLTYIFDMPDDLFKRIYPDFKKEFIKSMKNGEWEKEIFKNGVSREEKERTIKELNELKEESKKLNMCEEKIDLINLLIESCIKISDSIEERDSVKVSIELCHINAKEPTYANPNDAGCDVYAVENTTIDPFETKIIPTGLKMAIPAGWMISVRPRSGMSAKTGLRIANAPGTIDTGYRDEIGIILHNTSSVPHNINIGDRIAQLVIEPAPMIKFKKVDSVADIGEDRGGGFGHSGI